MAVLPTDSPTDIKLIIILIYSIGKVSKISRYFLNFAPKFLMTLHIFRDPSVIPRRADAVRDAFNAQPFGIHAVRR